MTIIYPDNNSMNRPTENNRSHSTMRTRQQKPRSKSNIYEVKMLEKKLKNI